MGIKRTRIFTVTCDSCGKSLSEATEERHDPNPVAKENLFDGWILDYHIAGNIIRDEHRQSFCSVTCLKKGIDKYYSGFNHINK